MSQSTHAIRLPYDDAAPLHEMRDDCQAASSRLHLPAPRHSAPAAASAPTRWHVPDSAARMADAIHMHLS